MAKHVKSKATLPDHATAISMIRSAANSATANAISEETLSGALMAIAEMPANAEDNLEIMDDIWRIWLPALPATVNHKIRNALQVCLTTGRQRSAEHLLHLILKSPSQSNFLANKRNLQALNVLFSTPVLKKDVGSLISRNLPEITSQLLDVMDRDELASLSGKLLVQYARLKDPQGQALTPANVQILAALLFKPETARNCLTYAVQPLLKILPSLYADLNVQLGYVKNSASSANLLEARIALAEVACAEGCIRREDLPLELMQECITHSFDSIRISALNIICRCAPSPTLRFIPADFILLQEYFTYNTGIPDAETRSKTLGAVYIFLDRLKTSTYAAARDKVKYASNQATVDDCHGYLKKSQDFLHWLSIECQNSIQPISPFRTTITSLGILQLMLNAGLDKRYIVPTILLKKKSTGWPDSVTIDIVNFTFTFRLLRCLKSTYTDIRNLAFNILSAFPKPLPAYEDLDTVNTHLVQPATRYMQNVRGSEAATACLVFRLAATHTSLSAGQFGFHIRPLRSCLSELICAISDFIETAHSITL